MPLRYKVGDKVRVKAELYEGYEDESTRVIFAREMERYCSKIITIKRAAEKGRRYRIEEDDGYWIWTDDFFEDANETFIENNVVLLRNGQIRLIHNDALYLPNGTFIEIENYVDRKHNFDENFDIIEVHRRPSGNYLFDLSGELIQEEK